MIKLNQDEILECLKIALKISLFSILTLLLLIFLFFIIICIFIIYKRYFKIYKTENEAFKSTKCNKKHQENRTTGILRFFNFKYLLFKISKLSKFEVFEAYVVKVSDGDSITICHIPLFYKYFFKNLFLNKYIVNNNNNNNDNNKYYHNKISIRLAGMDAPEMAHFGFPEQQFAQESTFVLKCLVLNKIVKIKPIKMGYYKRLVAYIYFDTDYDLEYHRENYTNDINIDHLFGLNGVIDINDKLVDDINDINNINNINNINIDIDMNNEVVLVDDIKNEYFVDFISRENGYIVFKNNNQNNFKYLNLLKRFFLCVKDLFTYNNNNNKNKNNNNNIIYHFNINIYMVKIGLAIIYRNEVSSGCGPTKFYKERFLEAEKEAKKLKLGIWSVDDFINPHVYRKMWKLKNLNLKLNL